MKFIQLLTVFTVLASSSVANAQHSCEQAGKKADRIVQRIFDGDCDNVDRDFTRKVNRMKNRTFPLNAPDRRDRIYNNCGRVAIQMELGRIDRQCGKGDAEDFASFINLPGDIDSLDTSEDQASNSKLRGAAQQLNFMTEADTCIPYGSSCSSGDTCCSSPGTPTPTCCRMAGDPIGTPSICVEHLQCA